MTVNDCKAFVNRVLTTLVNSPIDPKIELNHDLSVVVVVSSSSVVCVNIDRGLHTRMRARRYVYFQNLTDGQVVKRQIPYRDTNDERTTYMRSLSILHTVNTRLHTVNSRHTRLMNLNSKLGKLVNGVYRINPQVNRTATYRRDLKIMRQANE
jgi:hypothetical protein